MDGSRGRQGSNSSATAPAPASVMSSYYGPPSGDSGNSSYVPRDCFWTQAGSGVPGSTPVDPWATNNYAQQQMLPPQSPSYNNSPPNNNNSSSFNIPSYPPASNLQSRVPPSPINGTGIPNMNGNGNNGELSPFSGPSPPNPIQSIPYGAPPPNSPRSSRQYTPSTTPSPHVQQSPSTANINGMNGNSSSHSHSSHENSPPNSANSISNNNNFDIGYMNGNGGVDMNSSKLNGPVDPQSTGHPNELPGYLPPLPRSHNPESSRYPGELKSSDGDMMSSHQQLYQHSHYYHQNYANQYGEQQNMTTPPYYDSFSQSQHRRPFDPYQPYPNANQNYNEGGYGSSEEYNAGGMRSVDSNPGVEGGRRRDSISGLEAIVENGTKMDSGDSLQRHGKTGGSSSLNQEHGVRTSYDDNPNFESVLHGHDGYGGQNQFRRLSSDQESIPNNFQHHSGYSTHENVSQGMDSSTNSRNKSSSKCDENPTSRNNNSNTSNNGVKSATKKRERKRKSRSSSSACNNNNSDEDPTLIRKRPSFNSKDKSFLGTGRPRSPLNLNSNSSQSSSSNQSKGAGGQQMMSNAKSEGGESNTSPPFSDGGERSPNNNNDNSAPSFDSSNPNPKSSSSSESASASNASTSTKSTSRKKPWKKAKQINSEQLLEERERNCAEYIENSEKLKEKGSSKGKTIKHEQEPPIIPLMPYNNEREEKNITIDHQKEDQIYKHEHGSYDSTNKDNEPRIPGFESTDHDESSKVNRKDVPLVECGCFPIDEVHPEPGPFYTHLGAAHTLPELRELLEIRTGFRGPQLRFEKVTYTGKEGKTSQGCPLAKWIIRRGSFEEQLLFVVKHRKGHKCATAWIVVCCVIWEAVPPHFADNLYDTVVYKLNRFGVPTTRRSDTNEQRSCACQGVDPDTCGAAYSFGCAWSMFFNGCKYARSRNVRKFRLTEEHEEAELEEKIQHLATHLAPLYERVATESYRNQIEHENEGLECRLGYRPGRPFSGVTACVDYCSHAHKDAHNMINGCTVTVAFTRNRTLGKGDDEQYHVLPLYKLDETDEFGSKEGQKQKVRKGQLEILKKFQSKVRVRKVPLLPSRRRGKPKPPSSSSSGSSHHHHSLPSKPVDMYSSDLSSLSVPPPMKREKMSIFEELNGPSGGSDLFDSRFPHGPTAPSHFSNLLLSKSHSKLGMGMGLPPMSLEDHVQSCQISSTVLDSDGCPQSIWNTSPYGQLAQSAHSHGQPGGSSFRSYFDTPIAPTSQYSSKSSSQFGQNFDFHLSSTPRGSGNPMVNNSNSNANSLITPNLNSNSGSNNMQNTSNSMATPGYTSMSPSILPSFRHTFMTEAESLSMLSSMSSPSAGTGSPIADSTSSPRAGKQNTGQQLNLSTSSASNNTSTPVASFSHHNDSLGLNNPPSYFTAPTPIVPPNPYSSSTSSSLYHPHPHHPTPSSCLSSAPSQVGVPFNSPSSFANSSSSFVPPPAAMDPHHPFGMGMNMNPISSWNPNMNMNMNSTNYSHHGYGSVPPPPPPASSYHHNQMSSLGMNSMTPSAFPHMNQYNPYGSQTNFISPHAAIHSHHHSANPWVNPLPSFMSGPHSHPPPPAPSCFVAPPKPKIIPEVNESVSDNEDAFKDSHLGGVGIALTHGSVILQCAKHEMHATTSLRSPNRMYPSRICLVFYQHKSMNNRFHGWSEWEKKIEAKKLQEVKLINQGKLEASPRKMKQLIKEGYLADNP